MGENLIKKQKKTKQTLVVWLWAVLSPNNESKRSGAGTWLFVWAGLEAKRYLANISVQQKGFFFKIIRPLGYVACLQISLLSVEGLGETIPEHKTSEGGNQP